MPESSRIASLLSGKKGASFVESIEALLDVIPHAALLVRADNQRIVGCNAPATELTGFTHTELSGLHLNTLLAHIQKIKRLIQASQISSSHSTPTLQRSPSVLTRRDQSTIRLEVILPSTNLKDNLCLLVLQPLDPSLHTPSESKEFQSFWGWLSELVDTLWVENEKAALDQALQATCKLANLNLAVLYRTSTQKPALDKSISTENEEIFPAQLPVSDLMNLPDSMMWRAGEKTPLELLKIAHQSGLPFMAIAPVGGRQAPVGMLVASHTTHYPGKNTLAIIGLAASVMHAAIQRNAQATNLERQLQDTTLNLSTLEILEETSSDGYIWLNPDFTIVRINPAAGLILGYERHEVAGKSVDKLLVGKDDVLKHIMPYGQKSQASEITEKRFFRRNGEEFLCKFQVIPVFLQNELKHFLVRLIDMSDIESLQIQNQRLEQQARLGQAIQVFSHEARNPLNNISMYLQNLALNIPEDDPERESIDETLEDMDKLVDMFNAILQTSKNQKLNMEIVNIALLLKRMTERSKARFHKYRVDVDLHLPQICPPIRGDVRALEQVFTNLVNNALQAMKEKGGRLVISVKVKHHDNKKIYLEINFADTGAGIPPEMKDKLFQPFFTTRKRGTGLGLAISRQIITQHKGRLFLDSIPGATVFTVELPVLENS